MTKDEKCCNEENEILKGFKFGFGFFLAHLAGFSLISFVALLIYYVQKLF